jgi:ATP-dependent Clp protease ATP-binding subunit ClpC
MFERFTDQSRRALVLAQEEARRLRHDHIGTEHVLAGLLREERGAAAAALDAAGITLDAVRGQIVALAGLGQEQPGEHIPFTPRAKKGLELALREATPREATPREATGPGWHIGTGHLLLGLIGQDDCVGVQVLGALGADLGPLRARVIQETESRPESLEYSPPLRLRPSRAAMSDPVRALLDSIEDRLSAIERHLGMDSGDAGNVVPPS